MTNLPDSELSRLTASECVCFNLRRTTRLITALYDEALRPAGLRSTQFILLNALHLTGPAPISTIAEHLDMDRTTLTRNLKSLQRDSLATSRQGEDHRVRLIDLTEKGSELLAQAQPLWHAVQRSMVEGLGPQQWKSVVSQLERVSAVAERCSQPNATTH